MNTGFKYDCPRESPLAYRFSAGGPSGRLAGLSGRFAATRCWASRSQAPRCRTWGGPENKLMKIEPRCRASRKIGTHLEWKRAPLWAGFRRLALDLGVVINDMAAGGWRTESRAGRRITLSRPPPVKVWGGKGLGHGNSLREAVKKSGTASRIRPTGQVTGPAANAGGEIGGCPRFFGLGLGNS